MDKIKAFLAAMTIWNWLALIAFIFFPLSAINAFFSLRARYLDWQGQQSKVKFKKRLRQLLKQTKLIDRYRKEPQFFVLKVLDDASSILVIFLASVALFLCGWLLSSFNSSPPPLFLLTIATLMMSFDFMLGIQLSRLISRVRNPEAFAIRVYGFLFKGMVKGLLVGHDEMVESILQSDTFNLIQGETDYVGSIKRGWPPPNRDLT
jgi:hypothetical protein